MAVDKELPFKLTTANLTVSLGTIGKKGISYTEVENVTDLTLKFDPKGTILNSSTHERVGVYWGPPELSIDFSCYATEDTSASILWSFYKAAMTREFVACKISVPQTEDQHENSDLYLREIEIDSGVVTAITPMKIATDGVQTMDFTITAMSWTITNRDDDKTLEGEAVDNDGPVEGTPTGG